MYSNTHNILFWTVLNFGSSSGPFVKLASKLVLLLYTGLVQKCVNTYVKKQIGFIGPLKFILVCLVMEFLGKGQLISKCPFGVFKLTKNQQNFCNDFFLASKKSVKSSVRESK